MGGEPLSFVDGQKFKQACFALAHTLNAKVLRLETELQVGRNFIVSELLYKTERILALCNAHFPYIAFATAEGGFYAPIFQDSPHLVKGFELTGEYIVLPQSLLDASTSVEQLAQLSDAELNQIRYWKPQRIGDIIFNHWD